MEQITNSLNYLLQLLNLKKVEENKFEKPKGYKNVNTSQYSKTN